MRAVLITLLVDRWLNQNIHKKISMNAKISVHVSVTFMKLLTHHS